ncbi:Mitochondrial uncoupling protein 4 [Geodia barretti]|uniref:Mitochondrial uncoupling protein 4 n=1 Tax=Geodia barretti TaxID=519541 RepID=A0AA35TGT4_GEOBA|nr:Mitochondrial uncoupling protein 4 [Geodia barretti]
MAGSSRQRDSFVLKYLLTISAATVSESVTFPLDIVKTRLQVSRQLSGLPRVGLVGTAASLVRKEGFLRLWAGLRPAVLRHWVYSGCRMSFYELIRDHVFKRDSRGRYPLWKAVPTGMIAGAGGQFIASPMDRVKIILQIEGASSSTSSLPRLVKGATLPPVAPSDVLRKDQRNMENSERYSEERRRERSVEGMGSQLPESCSRLPRRSDYI